MLIKKFMHKLGHTIVVVENGQEAVDAVGSAKFDCVLMDIQMPVRTCVGVVSCPSAQYTLAAETEKKIKNF